MKRSVLLIVILLPFIGVVGAGAQTATPTISPEQQRVEALHQKMDRLQRQLTQQRKSQKQDSKALAAIEQEMVATRKALETSEAIHRSQIALEQKQESNRIWFFVLSGVGVVLLSVLIARRASRGRSAIVVSSSEATEKRQTRVLTNPDVSTLRLICRDHQLYNIPFTLKLESDPDKGRFLEGTFSCIAVFNQDSEEPVDKQIPHVRFESEAKTMRWDRAKMHAAMIAEKMTNASNMHTSLQ